MFINGSGLIKKIFFLSSVAPNIHHHHFYTIAIACFYFNVLAIIFFWCCRSRTSPLCFLHYLLYIEIATFFEPVDDATESKLHIRPSLIVAINQKNAAITLTLSSSALAGLFSIFSWARTPYSSIPKISVFHTRSPSRSTYDEDHDRRVNVIWGVNHILPMSRYDVTVKIKILHGTSLLMIIEKRLFAWHKLINYDHSAWRVRMISLFVFTS